MTDFIKKNNVLDDFGRLTEPMPDDFTGYNFGKIKEYCNNNNKTLSDLTEDELIKFRIDHSSPLN